MLQYGGVADDPNQHDLINDNGLNTPEAPIFVQSFEPSSLQYMRSHGLKTKIVQLIDALRLVPACPDNGSRCPRCEGERWDKPLLREHGVEIICGICRGRGWTTPAMLEAAKARP